MNITYLTHYNLHDPTVLSGTPFWIYKSLIAADMQLQPLSLSPLQQLLPFPEEFLLRCKQIWHRVLKAGYIDYNLYVKRAQHIAKLVSPHLSHKKIAAVLTSNTPIAGAFVETKAPLIYWTDYVFAGIANFHPHFRELHPDSQWDAHHITNACLLNAKLLIFSSDWAARHATEFYGIAKNKIKVIPFGANLEIKHDLATLKNIISARTKKTINILFVGKNWYLKGGDIVLRVTQELHNAGYPVQLTIVGCKPNEDLPHYVKCENLLSKKYYSHLQRLEQLYREAHFLFLPSRSEAFGIVFCEANAFGLPCISTYVGGISTIIKDDINGKMFSLEATLQDYCDYIINLMNDENRYAALALSSFNEYNTRLNWQTSAQLAKQTIKEII